MLPKRLVWRLVFTHLIVIAVFTAVVLGSLSRSLRGALVEDAQVEAERVARLLAARIASEGLGAAPDEPSAFASRHGLEAGWRLTVVDRSGRVLADSLARADQMEDHGDRPEIRQAFEAEAGRSERYSRTAGRDLVYAAVRAELPGGRAIAVRTSTPVKGVEEALRELFQRVGFAAAAVAVAAVALGWLVSLWISRQLAGMAAAAESYAAGDFAHQVPPAGFEELDGLGRSLQRMAAQLDERLRTIAAQGLEQQAVLSSLTEAVLAVDRDGAVLSLNGAAAALLGRQGGAEARPLQELLRDAAIDELVREVLASGEPAETETVLRDGTGRHLSVRASALRGESSEPRGVVLVLADVTRLRRLERVRQEFVANVSHELRTPVTSVKGFLETLQDGALEEPERARRFVDIARRQADRLQAIIEDLLTLSRLESEEGGIETAPARLASVIAAAVEDCSPRAEERGVSLRTSCDEGLRAELNAALIEQALANLIDNAVKFSERGGEVRIEALRVGNAVLLRVEDDGPGIPHDQQPRLFERFYRVDRARSRAEGGTGLGLAIVKHVAQAHGGSIEVRSRLGEGSVFTLTLPDRA